MKIFAHVGLLIFLYLVTYHVYVGILNPITAPGDSWDYHIPISKSILNGSFLDPSNFSSKQYFAQLNPGSSEAFNSILIFLNIPLTLSNIFASVVLFFCCFTLAKTFKLSYYPSLLFALTIGTLTVITRWFNSVSIDVWLAVFFVIVLILLEKPKKTFKYFFFLGAAGGMLVGSKYSAWGFIFILFLFYSRSIFRTLNFQRFIVFLIPFSLLGIFWYVRNYLAVGNPLWPICLFSLPCKAIYYNNHEQMWDMTIAYPLIMFNALFSEYKLWCLSLIAGILILFRKFKSQILLPPKTALLTGIGFANLLFFAIFPTSPEPWIMVSSFRYSYPTFIPLILVIFLLSQKYKKEELLGYFAIANMLPMLTMAFYPKLVLPTLITFIIYLFFERKNCTKIKISAAILNTC